MIVGKLLNMSENVNNESLRIRSKHYPKLHKRTLASVNSQELFWSMCDMNMLDTCHKFNITTELGKTILVYFQHVHVSSNALNL